MVVMYRFVFWFSTRFGCLVVAGLTVIQSLTFLTICCVWMDDEYKMKYQFQDWFTSDNKRSMPKTLEDITENSESYLTAMIIYLSLHCFTILMLIYGALKVVVWMVYPFLALELARLLFITISFIAAMLLLKENVVNLGFLIACCCGGGFVLLFLYYLWFCVISFVQIVKKLEFIHGMGHHEGGRLNMETYRQFNVPEVGPDYYMRDDRFGQKNAYNFNRKYFNDRLPAKLNADNAFANVLARPVY